MRKNRRSNSFSVAPTINSHDCGHKSHKWRILNTIILPTSIPTILYLCRRHYTVPVRFSSTGILHTTVVQYVDYHGTNILGTGTVFYIAFTRQIILQRPGEDGTDDDDAAVLSLPNENATDAYSKEEAFSL